MLLVLCSLSSCFCALSLTWSDHLIGGATHSLSDWLLKVSTLKCSLQISEFQSNFTTLAKLRKSEITNASWSMWSLFYIVSCDCWSWLTAALIQKSSYQGVRLLAKGQQGTCRGHRDILRYEIGKKYWDWLQGKETSGWYLHYHPQHRQQSMK